MCVQGIFEFNLTLTARHLQGGGGHITGGAISIHLG